MPKTMPKSQTIVRIEFFVTKQFYDALKKAADDQQVPVSQLVEHILVNAAFEKAEKREVQNAESNPQG